MDLACSFLIADGNQLQATVDMTVYSQSSLLNAVHRFTDGCYIHLQHDEPNLITVRFKAKKPSQDLSAVAGEFFNALLDQTLREQIQAETEAVRNLILAHALSDTILLHSEMETTDAHVFVNSDVHSMPPKESHLSEGVEE